MFLRHEVNPKGIYIIYVYNKYRFSIVPCWKNKTKTTMQFAVLYYYTITGSLFPRGINI